MSALVERSKVNLDLCNLFIAIVTLDKTYQVRTMTLALAVCRAHRGLPVGFLLLRYSV